MVHPVYQSMGTTIFEEMSGLSRTLGAINLGQGFPDEDGPEDVRRAAADALLNQSNQYAPMMGLPGLRQAVADHYRAFQGLSLSADNVAITSGATEAIAASIFALVSEGDEVVLIEPMYDAYRPLVLRAGGVPRALHLRPPLWRIEEADVAAAFSDRTRMVVFNNPHNPTARLFDRTEVALLAEACRRHDAIALCDEVWEHIFFGLEPPIPMMALPGMASRTIKIGSAGKIFGMTGWKVGFIIADEALLGPVARAHQFLTFATPPALQAGVAYGLRKDETYFLGMRDRLRQARDRLDLGLRTAGFVPLASEGTYFLCIDLARSGIDEPDHAFAQRAVHEVGVATIPLSPFYAGQSDTGIVRLCFAKAEATIDAAVERLSRLR